MSTPHGIDRTGAPAGSGAQGLTGQLNDLADPGADRILFWDDSASQLDWLSLGTGLSISNTALTLASGLVDVAGLTPSDGGFIVGDGANWTVESGATARASLGIVDAESPDAGGEFIVGVNASNSTSVRLPPAGHPVVSGRVNLSVSAGILTVTLTRSDGSNATSAAPIFVRMPSDASSVMNVRQVTGALSMTVSSGSTLGHSNAVASAVYIYLLDNAGTIELAVSSKYYGYGTTVSTTTEGGAGGADSRSTMYSGTGRTSVCIVPIMRWQSTQTSAGVWAAVTGITQNWPWPYKAPTTQTFLSTATYTKPWDMLVAEIEVQGGGGAGGTSANTGNGAGSGAGGGGAGGYSRKVMAADEIAPTVTMTVGVASGTSSFGAHCSATGGSAGTAGPVNGGGLGGAGGVGSGGDLNLEGSDGASGSAGTLDVGGTPLASATGGSGGNAALGGGGRGGAVSSSVGNDSVGLAGNVYGGGGGGGASAEAGGGGASGGAGALGIGIVREYYAW